MKNPKKWIPLCFLIIVIILFYSFNIQKYFNFSFLQQEHQWLKSMVAEHFFLSLFLFSILYIIVTATSLPIAAFLTILGLAAELSKYFDETEEVVNFSNS